MRRLTAYAASRLAPPHGLRRLHCQGLLPSGRAISRPPATLGADAAGVSGEAVAAAYAGPPSCPARHGPRPPLLRPADGLPGDKPGGIGGGPGVVCTQVVQAPEVVERSRRADPCPGGSQAPPADAGMRCDSRRLGRPLIHPLSSSTSALPRLSRGAAGPPPAAFRACRPARRARRLGRGARRRARLPWSSGRPGAWGIRPTTSGSGFRGCGRSGCRAARRCGR